MQVPTTYILCWLSCKTEKVSWFPLAAQPSARRYQRHVMISAANYHGNPDKVDAADSEELVLASGQWYRYGSDVLVRRSATGPIALCGTILCSDMVTHRWYVLELCRLPVVPFDAVSCSLVELGILQDIYIYKNK